ncbi:hypothetical protein [Saccharolobus caldissimus]|uniref:Transcriptional regulator n=1 Tax=Saccharolobus caldissimus TaxID=1702097 RepID=A0AAQ4CQ95_9CREN|nr:hypothetical protein [Saccharolobus caldissimus]BDB97976.1 transcriptional regulator [Saccharolobus caldissimus]
MMKTTTYCEDAYFNIVPVLKTVIIMKMVEKGISLRDATKHVNLSVTAYERHRKNDVDKIEKIYRDEEIKDMINSLAIRLMNNERIDPISFCILCSKSRRLFNLPLCI